MKKNKNYSGVLIKHKNKFLLCKRNNKGSLPGVWSIPAGKINNGETPHDGALREFYEETNIKLENDLKLIGFLTRTNRDGMKDKGLLYVFSCEVDEEIIPDLEKAKDGDEHTTCSYFNFRDLPFEDENEQLYNLIMKTFK